MDFYLTQLVKYLTFCGSKLYAIQKSYNVNVKLYVALTILTYSKWKINYVSNSNYIMLSKKSFYT